MTFDFGIQKCECCEKEYLVEIMLSCNTFGMSLRSDGKKIGGNIIEPKIVFKCDNCFNINWIKQEKIQGDDKIPPKINLLPSLSMEVCEEIILNKLYTDLKTETYIRIKYWQLCNDRNNNEKFKLDKDNKILIYNLNVLLNILKEDISMDKQLLRCEIFRELGLFKKAQTVLLRIKNSDNYPIIGVFEKLINGEDDRIQTIF